MILLADSGSGIWLLGVTDQGLLTTTPSSGAPVTLFLNDLGGNSWQIGVTTSGLLTTTSVSNASYPQNILIFSPAMFVWQLSVLVGGLLQTANVTPAQPFAGSGDVGSAITVGRIRRMSRSEFVA